MLVRVKETLVENFYGFHGIKRRYPGDEFRLEDKTDDEGKVICSAESQFSKKWMEKVEETQKRKRRSREEIDADNAINLDS